ncbi:MAG: flavocytochrome c [Clostridiales bacterium]|jgi:fumarate reductase flavoprotein subunit|nr:flavocytochrome c [Clostridiales bacterium]
MNKTVKTFVLLIAVLVAMSAFFACSAPSTEPNVSPTDQPAQPGANGEAAGGYIAGAYSATARGYNADLTVSVTVSKNAITNITVGEHAESVGVGLNAVAMMPARIIEAQSLAVDTVTGATITSATIINAVGKALEEAGADIAKLKEGTAVKDKSADAPIELTADVLVIGGGGAGLSATIEAARKNANVVLIEWMDYLGGDTGRAGGGIEGAGTRFQQANGIDDKPEDFFDFIKSRGVTYRNDELLRTMVNESAAAVDFLAELGADMSMQVAGHGSPVERAHRPAQGPAGQNIVQPMINEIGTLHNVTLYTGTCGYELLTDENGAVTGAKAKEPKSGQEYVISAGATVIATGNFASNNEMVAQYDPRLRGIGTNSSAGSQGDGIVMATAVGADVENMDIMRIRPTLPTNVNNFIAVSQRGRRFMDEYHSSDTIFVKGDDAHIQVVADTQDKHYWVLFDETTAKAFAAQLSVYMRPGQFQTAATIAQLATLIDVDAATLQTTVDEWNGMVAAGKDTLFGRTKGMDTAIGEGAYYACKVLPTAHTTAGGIRINTAGEVLDKTENVIPGLYAGGEVTGGVHDGVSAVTSGIVYGRICGKNAAGYALAQ